MLWATIFRNMRKLTFVLCDKHAVAIYIHTPHELNALSRDYTICAIIHLSTLKL